MTGNTRGSTAQLADSTIAFKNSQGVESRGTLIHLTRSNIIFEVYNPYSIVQLSEVLPQVRVRRADRVIYDGRAMVANLVSTGLVLIVNAAVVDPWADLSGLASPEAIRSEADRFVHDWREQYALRSGFQLATTRLSSFCSELARWLDGTEVAMQRSDLDSSLSHEQLYPLTDRVEPQLHQLWADFEGESAALADDELPYHKNFAQTELHPLTMSSPWLNRCFSKPFGYAGDYVMLNMLLEDPYAGHNAYSKIINHSLVTTDPPVAYKNRITMLVERLKRESERVRREHGRPLRAMTVGCGPVNEVQRFMRETPDLATDCQFHLMDFNQPTIDFACQKINEVRTETQVPIEVRFTNKSIHDLLKEARGRAISEQQTYDFVYCAGLFDYLSNRICGSLIELFYDWLEPGGLVTVTNVAHSEPIQNTLEILMEWYLIYRSGEDMLQLTPETGRQSIAIDETGIDIFLDVRNPSDPTEMR